MAERLPRAFRGRPLTGPEVEEYLARMIDRAEDDAEELERLADAAAEAEAAYRAEHAKLVLAAPHKTDAKCNAHATHFARDLFLARKRAEAILDARRQAIWMRGREMEAVRTLAVGARVAETGRGA